MTTSALLSFCISFARCVALLTCGALLLSPLYAADIYRWVDENGRTQFSDVVPEKYKKSAKRMESRPREISAEQRREAEDRAAKERALAEEAAQKRTRVAPDKPAKPGSASGNKPSSASNDGTDCATLYRLYRESIDCFAPYVTANGTTKAEAFQKCKAVADPSRKCGPAK